ncbi:MAG: gamma-glutamyltransferase [Gammaproteobacteria bacterium 39-13]|nr:gamma-glutamyltransferase [Gammaproteobacteria bacterium]OJV88929.1 MAG: gamma-glutamyltransferase [Gammaproteobacteria bacterium 39-13]
MNGIRLFLILSGFAFILFVNNVLAQNPPQTAIATSHPLASKAGMEIMRQGGNAFDAAVTVASVLAVVEPYNSGLGGGGFWLLEDRRKGNTRKVVIDARERAPLRATQDMFMAGEIPSMLAKEGALAAAIPGEVAGIVYLAYNYGNLALEKTLAPAIQFAENGFPVDEIFIKKIKTHQSLLEKFPATKAIFIPHDQIPTLGTSLKQPALAEVLKIIAKEGHSGFYTGLIANKLVKDVKQNGGIWSLDDLKHYQVNIREPIKRQYHDMNITTVGLPSAGGIALLTALNILSEFELDGLSDADHKHLIVESLRRASCDRARYLGDPDFVSVDEKKLLSKEHADNLRETISINHATSSGSLACGEAAKEDNHTTHYSILDQQGNSVSATLTINSQFGSGVIAEGTGILLNNEMDDFALTTGASNKDGLIGHSGNLIAPRKRPLSSMTPLFFENTQGMGILGTAGGSRIPSMMLIALLRADEEYLPQTWVMTPRFGHQYLPDAIFFEPEAFSIPLQNALKIRGHHLQQTNEAYGDMQAIFWDKKKNRVYAEADPRGHGLALVETLAH